MCVIETDIQMEKGNISVTTCISDMHTIIFKLFLKIFPTNFTKLEIEKSFWLTQGQKL